MNTIAYEKHVRVFMRLVRGYSPTAAAELEDIYATYGAQAAYHAAVALSLLVGRMKRHDCLDPVSLSNDYLTELPGALDLYHKAAAALTHDLQQKLTNV